MFTFSTSYLTNHNDSKYTGPISFITLSKMKIYDSRLKFFGRITLSFSLHNEFVSTNLSARQLNGLARAIEYRYSVLHF